METSDLKLKSFPRNWAIRIKCLAQGTSTLQRLEHSTEWIWRFINHIWLIILLESVRHFRSVVTDTGSRGTTAHAHQCCRFQSYAKTVPSRMKFTMKLTMHEPASMTTDTWSWRVTSYFNSALRALMLLPADSNQRPHSWESVVLIHCTTQLLLNGRNRRHPFRVKKPV